MSDELTITVGETWNVSLNSLHCINRISTSVDAASPAYCRLLDYGAGLCCKENCKLRTDPITDSTDAFLRTALYTPPIDHMKCVATGDTRYVTNVSALKHDAYFTDDELNALLRVYPNARQYVSILDIHKLFGTEVASRALLAVDGSHAETYYFACDVVTTYVVPMMHFPHTEDTLRIARQVAANAFAAYEKANKLPSASNMAARTACITCDDTLDTPSMYTNLELLTVELNEMFTKLLTRRYPIARST